jgi:class 3 adenylate cyclase
MPFDLATMSLAEMLRLRGLVSSVLARRFERNLALVFSDVVGSTPYFARFGDEAGRGLQQRHLDLLGAALPRGEGRIVDTAGDGALTTFPTADHAVTTLLELQRLIAAQNEPRDPAHHLAVRCGVHFGSLLTDGTVVTGDAVNLCARVTATAQAREIRITHPAWVELSPAFQSRCKPLPPVSLKGIGRPVELLLLEWRAHGTPPNAVRIEESGAIYGLPDKPTITFGRLRLHEGLQANDIVLWMPDRARLMAISRWHFELRHGADALYVHPLSDQTTEVDGVVVAKGGRAPIHAGSVVRLAEAMTLTFLQESVRPGRARQANTSGEWTIGGAAPEVRASPPGAGVDVTLDEELPRRPR